MSDEGKLYVGRLNFETNEESLEEAFGLYGLIEEVYVIRDRETRQSRGFGFVKYYNAEDAQMALEAMDGMLLDGRIIRVDRARQGRRFGSSPRGGRFSGSQGRGGRGYYQGEGYNGYRSYGDWSYGGRHFRGDQRFGVYRSGAYSSGGYRENSRGRSEYNVSHGASRDGYTSFVSEGRWNSGAYGSSQNNPIKTVFPEVAALGPSQDEASGSSVGLQMHGANSQVQPFHGGSMTEDCQQAVKNATSEAIDDLHKSLESCPDAEASDPKGIKVSLLAHQRSALAWLIWRETQKPCGGILADDMGLGKTLTMIALILAQKTKPEEEETISETDSSLVVSKGTLIICPAALIHHWEKEIKRHVETDEMTVYLYHGSKREKNPEV